MPCDLGGFVEYLHKFERPANTWHLAALIKSHDETGFYWPLETVSDLFSPGHCQADTSSEEREQELWAEKMEALMFPWPPLVHCRGGFGQAPPGTSRAWMDTGLAVNCAGLWEEAMMGRNLMLTNEMPGHYNQKMRWSQ
ncbi:hypothetical protein P7K49_027411 [Saguinus oedipus]|uniref:Uncharacterized protein n=1 Tax=Saguinus oedipus TaxID=9490 RepID=A0ABQ9U9F0_SAGOE|nr:hypothetical protein P7K49_027411 [Saguinus oedipus]